MFSQSTQSNQLYNKNGKAKRKDTSINTPKKRKSESDLSKAEEKSNWCAGVKGKVKLKRNKKLMGEGRRFSVMNENSKQKL